jgi:hypothetical protein
LPNARYPNSSCSPPRRWNALGRGYLATVETQWNATTPRSVGFLTLQKHRRRSGESAPPYGRICNRSRIHPHPEERKNQTSRQLLRWRPRGLRPRTRKSTTTHTGYDLDAYDVAMLRGFYVALFGPTQGAVTRRSSGSSSRWRRYPRRVVMPHSQPPPRSLTVDRLIFGSETRTATKSRDRPHP